MGRVKKKQKKQLFQAWFIIKDLRRAAHGWHLLYRHREREIKDVALHNCFLLNSKMFFGQPQKKKNVDRNIQEDTGGSSGRLIFADVSCVSGRGLRFKADLLLFDPSDSAEWDSVRSASLGFSGSRGTGQERFLEIAQGPCEIRVLFLVLRRPCTVSTVSSVGGSAKREVVDANKRAGCAEFWQLIVRSCSSGVETPQNFDSTCSV